MKRRLYVISAATVSFAFVTLTFSNCSKVAFEAFDAASEVDQFGNTSGSIIIDGGNQFTKHLEVVATLNHGSAEEMYITDVPNCSSGGEWETYSSFKRWHLKSTNQEVKLFAKFREKVGTSQESDCYEDAIIHDNIAPFILAQNNLPQYTNLTNLNINFQVTDNLSGVQLVECKKGQGAFETCTVAMALQALTEGAHTAQIKATDRAGNISTPMTLGVTVDLTPPTLQFNSAPSSRTADLNGSFTFSGNDNLSGLDRFECRPSDSSPWVSCTSPLNQSFSEGNHRFSIRAYDRVGNVSDPIIHSWTIDRSAPSVRITRSPMGYSNQQVAQLEFSGVPGGKQIVRFECSLDGAAYANCSSPYTTGYLSDGAHRFAVRGYDDVGNVSQPAEANWNVDTKAPIASIISGPPNPTNNPMASLAFEGSDTGGSGLRELQCQINNSGFSVCTSVRNYIDLADGSYTFQVRAVDNAGNIGPVASHVWRVDLIKPTVQITSGPSAQTRNINAELKFIANDAHPGQVAFLECRMDAAVDWESCSSPKNYVGLNQGAHSFQVRAIDTAGNISDIQSHAWFVDSIGPAINIGQQPMATLMPGQPAPIQFVVTDSGVGVQQILCGLNGALTSCQDTETRDYSNLPNGNYIFRIEASDLLGNFSSREISWKVEQLTMPVSQNINVNTNRKADILVVIDNSGSMMQEQANMGARFGSFLDQLNGLDWQVGVTTTDIASTLRANEIFRKDGRLLPIANMSGHYKLTSSMDPTIARQNFSATVQRPPNEGSGDEQGIGATYRVLQRNSQAFSSDNPTGGFLRDGAILSVVVVSDANETNPSGTQVYNSPQGLLNLVQSMYPGKPFSFHSIIVKPNDRTCLNLAGSGNEGYGYAYETLSGLTGGVVGTVCSSDYGSQLAAMGRATVDLINSANLNCAPLDTNGDGTRDIQIVTADGSAAPSYTIDGLRVQFSRALPAGNNQLNYSCLTQ